MGIPFTFNPRVVASTKSYRMSRILILAFVVAMAAIASAQFNNFGYLGYGYGGSYNPYNNFNQQYYPNIVGGYGFYGQQPFNGFQGCSYWCQSFYQRQYYCCTTPQQAFNQNSGFGGVLYPGYGK